MWRLCDFMEIYNTCMGTVIHVYGNYNKRKGIRNAPMEMYVIRAQERTIRA